MKNLKLASAHSFNLDLQSEDEALHLSAFDIERNRLFLASSANIIYSFQLPSSEKAKSWSNYVQSPQRDPVVMECGDFISAMDYLIEKDSLVLGTSNGCLLLHNIDGNATEIVGRVEGGVKSIACSPDGALLAVTAGLGQLLVLTHDWDVLHETSLNPEVTESGAMGDADGYSCSQFQAPITWRADGKYFATLGGLHEHYLQKLRVWERENGMLHSATEAKVFMDAAIDWMPSGAKVAAAYDRKAENKCPLVVFFEKNGLERSYFPVDELVEINNIKWNCGSDLLAISVTCNKHDAVKVWYFSNNHWYLKQEIRFSKKDGMKFMWDPTKPMHLICWTLNGRIMTYNFVWISAVTEDSIALVVDGSKLLVSPLSLSIMPPPMSLFTLKFPNSIQEVSFLCKNSKSQLAACLTDSSLCVAELPRIISWEHLEGKELKIDTLCSDLHLGKIMHLMWLDSHLLLGVSMNECDLCSPVSWRESDLTHHKVGSPTNYYLLEVEVVCSEDSVPDLINSSGWRATLLRTSPLEGPVVGLVSNPCKRDSAFVQMEGGSIFEYSSTFAPRNLQLCELNPEYGFSASCPWMNAIIVSDNGLTKTLLFGLDYNGNLRVGKRTFCRNCSSFTFYSNNYADSKFVTHLILTTKQDLLFIFSMDDILHGNIEMKIEEYNDIRRQRDKVNDCINLWERGAKLVGALHGDEAAVILQSNRGNLECIYPRKMVITSILHTLEQRRFKDALLMVRRHRIDFNFIIDCFGWQTFVKSAEEFVNQVSNLAHITEFVSSIKNGNVMDALYKDRIFTQPHGTSNVIADDSRNVVTESKVNSVLWAIRKALEEQVQENPSRELCILTTLARNEPPALEEALKRIKTIREMELSGVNDARMEAYPSAEECLKHLLWLTDPEAVFEAALGLYDLNLAAIVALNSQKDPKEFVPYLKELEGLPPSIMRYKIDLRLQRFESALKHIFSAGEGYHDECMNLIKNNPQLFPIGLELFACNFIRNEIMEAWGDHLHDEKCFQDAAAAFLSCSSFQKALKAYHGCGDWKGMLTVGSLMGLGKDNLFQLANELSEEFQALGKPAEAAKISLEYCNDVGRGVGCYIMAREWEEALRISYLHEREDLTSNVADAASECASALMSEYRESSEKVGKYLARYLAVRQRRIILASKIHSEDNLMKDIDYDSVSEISSSLSEMSAYTARTLKDSVASSSSTTVSKARQMNSRRHKGGKIRAGSPGEEMALVEHLKGMSLTEACQIELKSLLLALITLGKGETARQLQLAALNFQLTQRAAVKLAEDTMNTDWMDENTHSLEHYIKNLKGTGHSQTESWQLVILPHL
ncbi:Elongator complex protein 1 [Apostasia shenzhenica]|uniref:Elongator complex protein 1 n=1 Tax=Apostasia shenzhenica TaxID=1088818 RepID=A0A2I0B270_9ASPA|nr:Elongator complex protein 1 [Apostasia shenzhenica]